MSSANSDAVDLFTPDEDAVLARWFGVEPPESAKGVDVAEAVERLGFKDEPGHYELIDAAVAFILIERAEQHKPPWASVSGGRAVVLARKYRDSDGVPERKVILQPRSLFEINWADSGPGFSWPVSYYATWVPHYDRFVVTASADCPDAFGYCDFALGAFGGDTPIKDGAKSIICGDWRQQLDEWCQSPWEYLFDTGLISGDEARAWADEVWATEVEEDAEDDDATNAPVGIVRVKGLVR
jgi:hypothetical protein